MSSNTVPSSLQPGNGGNGASPPGKDAAWIAALLDELVPKFQGQGNSSANDSEMGNGTRGKCQGPGDESQQQSTTDGSDRLNPEFVFANARKARNEAKAPRASGDLGGEALVEHHNKLSRSIQLFVKFFLGNPAKPQDYPRTPTAEELADQYLVEKRSAVIVEQLDRVRDALAGRPDSKIDYYVSVAEREIRCNIVLPPFTPATKADVERAFELAGISRITFEWAKAGGVSAWNSAVVDVLATKAIDWILRTTSLREDQVGQAPAIIQRWVQTKSREMREFQDMEVPACNKLKNEKIKKDQYLQWRKKIQTNRCSMVDKFFKQNIALADIVENKACGSDIKDSPNNHTPLSRIPDWRSHDLTTILHSLDKMVIAEGVHHKTIAANERLYARSMRNYKTTKGIFGVPRGLPLDSYDKFYWARISPHKQDTILKVPAIGLAQIAEDLRKMCNRSTPPSGSGPAATDARGQEASNTTQRGAPSGRGWFNAH
ncbi:hypothetical protein PTTG_29107 [Puccinia triticina 1-1 BBBD Race 1]|uniref:Uncharacterized protein n=1 Tax=Puccinia triticina (isolate 1-1 / race 1 (BBBD)) TaxID=630390 RepID=A0A180G8J6_PUCT1|nr:hypothetical protein PTTG_29107 [Puccinia triticina 1-1 BBBD Race 1]